MHRVPCLCAGNEVQRRKLQYFLSVGEVCQHRSSDQAIHARRCAVRCKKGSACMVFCSLLDIVRPSAHVRYVADRSYMESRWQAEFVRGNESKQSSVRWYSLKRSSEVQLQLQFWVSMSCLRRCWETRHRARERKVCKIALVRPMHARVCASK